MMDRILIQDLALRGIIGVTAEERRERQDIVINLTLELDLAPAGHSDDLTDTVDYKALKKRILSLVEGSHFRLVEALAERIADLAIEDPRVAKTVVRVEKPGALRFARSVGVEITRERRGPIRSFELRVASCEFPTPSLQPFTLQVLGFRFRVLYSWAAAARNSKIETRYCLSRDADDRADLHRHRLQH